MPRSIDDRELRAFIASYSGCNGGNRDADLWICAIEPGGDTEEEYLKDYLKPEPEPGSWDERFKKDREQNYYEEHNERRNFEDISGDQRYGWKVDILIAKMLLAVQAWQNTKLPPVDLGSNQYKPFMRHELYTARGGCLRLNLFPLSDRGEDPPNSRFVNYRGHHPALDDKDTYREYCRRVRFKFFQDEFLACKRPRVVLGIGIRRAQDFADAFGFRGDARDESLDDGANPPRSLKVFSHNDSTLLVVPFFGGRHRNGIRSHKSLIALAKRISDELEVVRRMQLVP